jgi:catechol 2,3-dioxygenase-like lactoylglutathione lyase family enzyme
MEMKIELIIMPVTDTDRSKEFYADKLGFHVDHDTRVNEKLRFVQLTPPGSACSIAFGTGLEVKTKPGEMHGLQAVVSDIEETKKFLNKNGVEHEGIDDQPWGRFIYFSDPDGNSWSIQQIPPKS